MGVCASSNATGPYDPYTVTLAHFKQERQIGEGSFGKVHAVTWRLDCPETRKNGKWFAMKALGKKKMLKDNAMKACVRELKLLSGLSHPFLSNLHCVFQCPRKVYFVLDLYLGGDLDYFARKTLRQIQKDTKNELFRYYAAEMMLGIDYCHKHRVVHRDIKPANVVIHSNGHLGLIDFNVALKIKDDHDIKNCIKGRTGTPQYMAPEVISKQNYGSPVDYWSLGAILFELFANRRVVKLPTNKKGEQMYEAITERIHKVTPQFIADKCEGRASDAAIEFISGCLRIDPTTRWGFEECKKSKFLENIDLVSLEKLETELPWKPNPNKSNFDAEGDADALLGGEDLDLVGPIPDSEQHKFETLSFRIWRDNEGKVSDKPYEPPTQTQEGA